MRTDSELGRNRTGIAFSPIHGKELIESAESAAPTSAGDERAMADVRVGYARDADPIGHVPPPLTVKGAVKTVATRLQGEKLEVLMDKLGERLAFERTGSRLYEALIAKVTEAPVPENGPTEAILRRFHDQELAHFEMVEDVIRQMGGDPTAVTPSADVNGVLSMGLPQVLTDPRTSLMGALQAILVAELADNDGWSVLIQLATHLGEDDVADRFEAALEEEDLHLATVRQWIADLTIASAR